MESQKRAKRPSALPSSISFRPLSRMHSTRSRLGAKCWSGCSLLSASNTASARGSVLDLMLCRKPSGKSEGDFVTGSTYSSNPNTILGDLCLAGDESCLAGELQSTNRLFPLPLAPPFFWDNQNNESVTKIKSNSSTPHLQFSHSHSLILIELVHVVLLVCGDQNLDDDGIDDQKGDLSPKSNQTHQHPTSNSHSLILIELVHVVLLVCGDQDHGDDDEIDDQKGGPSPKRKRRKEGRSDGRKVKRQRMGSPRHPQSWREEGREKGRALLVHPFLGREGRKLARIARFGEDLGELLTVIGIARGDGAFDSDHREFVAREGSIVRGLHDRRPRVSNHLCEGRKTSRTVADDRLEAGDASVCRKTVINHSSEKGDVDVSTTQQDHNVLSLFDTIIVGFLFSFLLSSIHKEEEEREEERFEGRP